MLTTIQSEYVGWYCQQLFDWPIFTTNANEWPKLSDFSGKVLLELLQDVLITICNCMWFQYNETSADFSADVCTYLIATFGA